MIKTTRVPPAATARPGIKQLNYPINTIRIALTIPKPGKAKKKQAKPKEK